MRHRHLIATVLALLIACAGPQGPAGPAGAAGDPLTDATITPEVIWSWPQNGQVGPIYGFERLLSFRFNKIVNVRSVIAALRLAPLTPGYSRFSYTSSYVLEEPSDAFSMRLVADSGCYWEIGQSYTITLPRTWYDVSGNYPDSDYTVTFTPEPYFRVRYSSPANGDRVPLDRSWFDLTFNSRPDTSTILPALTVAPELPLALEQAYQGLVTVAVLAPLQAATLYTVTVGPDVKDVQGRPLHPQFEFSFRTE